ncbi:MAG: outer membrane lipid asymmetry maintenance protein MlaD [Acidisphaera sp.]|nr:outer membrane lipid asymmetry maintenance protein MlaD [Acidisphaera sp.]
MARRNPAEIATGAVVLLIAAGFLGYAVAHTGRSTVSGYTLSARFDHIDGLAVGSDVRLAGVKVGIVDATSIDPATYQAVVTMDLENRVKLPKDSSAEVTSDGLLGGKYLALSPGGDEQMIPAGGQITITQGSVSLEQLLGKFIFSVTDMVNAQKQGAQNQGAQNQGAAGQPPKPAAPQ